MGHPSSHGGTQDLVYMRVSMKMKSSIMGTIWGGRQFVGNTCLYSSMK